jgi:hypothetical protein
MRIRSTKSIQSPAAAFYLMITGDFALICQAGLGSFSLRSASQAIAVSNDIADYLLENGFVSLAPSDDSKELSFLLTAEGRRKARAQIKTVTGFQKRPDRVPTTENRLRRSTVEHAAAIQS